MLAGGTESCVDAISLAGFSRMKALSTQFNACPGRASRPFDKDRDGFVLSEGACVVVLESLEHALERDAPNIYCEILGYGMSGDAHHITKPTPQGATLSMDRALSAAGVRPEEVAYVNAHATSTPLGDASELQAIRDVFLTPGRERNLYVSSSKGSLGHMLGAAGAAEVAIAALTCHKRTVPPNANLDDAGGNEQEDMLSLPRSAVELTDDAVTVVTNSLGFGGTNTTLVLQGMK
jgi:3-oxoacyl-[acyl-carrier-protein] synthase II